MVDVKRVGWGRYEVRAQHLGYARTFRFADGGVLSSSQHARTAATVITDVSADCFITATLISSAISGLNTDAAWDAASHSQKACFVAWQDCIEKLHRIAAIVPSHTEMDSHSEEAGFTTGSRGISTFRFVRIPVLMTAIKNHIIRSAPDMSRHVSRDQFGVRWADAVCTPFDFSDVDALYAVCDFANNAPVITHKDADADEKIYDVVMGLVHKNQPGLIPVRAPAKIIRGDRAASLMNIMIPKIEENLAMIKDPEERAALQARLNKLANRVEVASANANASQISMDIRLSIETLEESVESRLPNLKA